MANFTLTGSSFKGLFSKTQCSMYPLKETPTTGVLKGHVTNNIKDCILCSICEKKCPADALLVDKANETWSYNPFACVLCGSCVSACPKNTLAMDEARTPISTSIEWTILKKPELTPEEKAAKEAAEKEKAERIAAAKAAKAAKEGDNLVK